MIIPIVVTAIALGRAFDMSTGTSPPFFIFDETDLQSKLVTINRTFTQSHYRLVQSSSEANDFLDVSGDLSLKAKNGDIGLQGYGKYLTQTINRDETVEVLISVYHEVKTETFPSYTTLRQDWQSKPQSAVGSHYIRSITYGGQLIGSYKLVAKKSEYMEEIKASVNANLALGGSVDIDAKGNFEKLAKSVEGKADITVTASATAGAISPPTSIEALLQLVDDYPSLLEKETGGNGAPLKIEIVELSSLQPDYTAYLKNYAMDSLLQDATNKYDDLRVSWQEYRDWEAQGQIWNDTQEKWINEYQKKLKQANRAMVTAITELDPTGGLDQFDEAFKVYGEDGENIPNRYARELEALKHKVEEKPFYWYPYTKAVSHYVHWGGVNCSLPSPEPLFVGYASTSPKAAFGNGGNLLCLSASHPAVDPKELSSGTVVSQINGLNYETVDEEKGQTLCAFCKLENATVAFTIPGRTECPEDMKLEYSGYLCTNRDAGTASDFVCLEGHPDGALPKKMRANQLAGAEDKDAATLAPVWMECKDCDEDEKKRYVNCVVCSR